MGGSQGDATYALGAVSNVGGVDWGAVTRTSDETWTKTTLEQIGFTVGTDYLFDETSGVSIRSHQMATVRIPCAPSGTTVRYRPDFDAAPSGGVTARAFLSYNYAPCTLAVSYFDCGNFDMTDLLIEVDSSCGVGLTGVKGTGPRSPPPPAPPACPPGINSSSAGAACGLPPLTTITVIGENGEEITKTVPLFVGGVAAPQPLTTRSACCRRDEIGGDACPWEFECTCCAPRDNRWTGEKNPAPFWDPIVGQFQADTNSKCEGISAVPSCPCCLHPDHPDAGLEHRCPQEWWCQPPPPETVAPVLPIVAGISAAVLTALIFLKPPIMRLQGAVLDDLGQPVVGATVNFKDGQARWVKFKAVRTTDHTPSSQFFQPVIRLSSHPT